MTTQTISLSLLGPTDVTTSGTYIIDAGLGGTANIHGDGVVADVTGIAGLTLLYDTDISGGATEILDPALDLNILSATNLGLDADGLGSSPGDGTLEVAPGIDVSLISALNFYGTGNALIFDSGTSVTVDDSAAHPVMTGDSIDLRAVTGATQAVWSQNGAGGTITLENSLNVPIGTIILANGSFATGAFTVSVDPNGGVDVTATCFAAGTRIATADGETAVEDIRIGDLVRTLNGDLAAVRWIGRRHYAARQGQLLGRNVQPVEIAPGALGPNAPARPLLLSPEHGLFLYGVLIRAGDLIDGSTINRRPDIRQVDYYHIELRDHAIILAEGAAVESFVDCDSRDHFDNAEDYAARYPNDSPARFAACAERLNPGTRLSAILTTLRSRHETRALAS